MELSESEARKVVDGLTRLPISFEGPLARAAERRVARVVRGCIVRRMPRMQVYLPDELYALVKKRRLPASELLQEAVRAEIRRRQLLAEGDKYVAELSAEVGKPTARQRAAATAVVKKLVARPRRKTG